MGGDFTKFTLVISSVQKHIQFSIGIQNMLKDCDNCRFEVVQKTFIRIDNADSTVVQSYGLSSSS